LSAPEGARSLVCAYCGAWLEVVRSGGDADRPGLGHDQIERDPISMAPPSLGNTSRTAGDRSDQPVSWQVVASFKSVSEWHEAARLLARVGIVTRMQDDPRDASYSTLAVPAVDTEISRHVLARLGPGKSLGI